MKPMVKATMPTVKAETRKTCDTEPAAGGIARTMTLARRAPGLRRAVRENGTSTHTRRPTDKRQRRTGRGDTPRSGKGVEVPGTGSFRWRCAYSFVAGPWRKRAAQLCLNKCAMLLPH